MEKTDISTCVGCGYNTGHHPNHSQMFKNHLYKKKHHPKNAWYFKTDCVFKHFKKNGTQTCSKDKPFYRLQDQKKHEETYAEYSARKEIEDKKKLTCSLCNKLFKRADDKKKHEAKLLCKYILFVLVLLFQCRYLFCLWYFF